MQELYDALRFVRESVNELSGRPLDSLLCEDPQMFNPFPRQSSAKQYLSHGLDSLSSSPSSIKCGTAIEQWMQQ